MRSKKTLSTVSAMLMAASLAFTGCASSSSKPSETKESSTVKESSTAEPEGSSAPAETTEAQTEAPETEPEETKDPNNFIKLALNVYYNDEDHGYYSNESGDVITVTDEGQYTVTFDCSKDLSDEAKAAGVSTLTNLTAIYIIDMGAGEGEQSPLKEAKIMYDEVVVDGTSLTVTLEEPKNAFKSSGVFDTNDPINGWEGSYVAEVDEDTSRHVVNFNSVKDPATISVKFTLSDMKWEVTETDPGKHVETDNPYINNAKFSDMDFSGMTALELSKYLGNGINLGNTMEACNTSYGKSLNVNVYEQAWGQPVTTEDMIIGMKNCGFDTIRIPVAWTNMMDYANDDYTINTALLDRIQQLVDWAINAEMFVIVNDHWDSGWWDKFGNDAEREQAWKIYEAIWDQVGNRFKDYSDMLIFESANEELGTWGNQGLSSSENYDLTNQINQKFVDIIRSQGGNNANRFLLIAGYNTNIDKTVSSSFVMPTDSAASKLFTSVHFYSPVAYCLDKNNYTMEMVEGLKWGLKEEYDAMEEELAKLKVLTDAGYGVIIGEYGALPAYIGNKSVELPCTMEYTNYFLDICDLSNYVPVLWSTGAFDRTTLMMLSMEQTEMYTSRCYAEETAKGDSYKSEVEKHMKEAKEAAPDHWEGQESYDPGTPVSWIMWNGGAGQYSVGDKFNTADATVGIKAHNVVVDGAGEYEVSLDFSAGNNGITFTALAIADGELLYPGCIINIKEITLDGNPIAIGKYYTCSDDKKCTRVNLYNGWVSESDLTRQIEKGKHNFRTVDGDLTGITATPIDPTVLTGFKNITIKYELIVPEVTE
ncbi:MAG: glycoside hydrolase family 5 protein [Lachnospiraceae bacterium]|nr:glycoside hydrolase family 5 protein [Lachnospiraceae bacterium]